MLLWLTFYPNSIKASSAVRYYSNEVLNEELDMISNPWGRAIEGFCLWIANESGRLSKTLISASKTPLEHTWYTMTSIFWSGCPPSLLSSRGRLPLMAVCVGQLKHVFWLQLRFKLHPLPGGSQMFVIAFLCLLLLCFYPTYSLTSDEKVPASGLMLRFCCPFFRVCKLWRLSLSANTWMSWEAFKYFVWSWEHWMYDDNWS